MITADDISFMQWHGRHRAADWMAKMLAQHQELSEDAPAAPAAWRLPAWAPLADPRLAVARPTITFERLSDRAWRLGYGDRPPIVRCRSDAAVTLAQLLAAGGEIAGDDKVATRVNRWLRHVVRSPAASDLLVEHHGGVVRLRGPMPPLRTTFVEIERSGTLASSTT